MDISTDRNLFYAITVQGLFSIIIEQTPSLILTSAADILPFTLNPRFILSIRELHAQSVRGHDIDTGFGMGHGGVRTFTNIGTAVHFADPGPEGRSDEIEDIPMEEQRAKGYVDWNER